MHEQFKSAHTRAVSSPLPKNIKHLTTGPKGNSEFCFPKTFNVGPGWKGEFWLVSWEPGAKFAIQTAKIDRSWIDLANCAFNSSHKINTFFREEIILSLCLEDNFKSDLRNVLTFRARVYRGSIAGSHQFIDRLNRVIWLVRWTLEDIGLVFFLFASL